MLFRDSIRIIRAIYSADPSPKSTRAQYPKIKSAFRNLSSSKSLAFARKRYESIQWPKSRPHSQSRKVRLSPRRDSAIPALNIFAPPPDVDTTSGNAESTSERVPIKSKSSKRSKVAVIEDEQPLAVKVNNAALVELKNACDDAVKLVRIVIMRCRTIRTDRMRLVLLETKCIHAKSHQRRYQAVCRLGCGHYRIRISVLRLHHAIPSRKISRCCWSFDVSTSALLLPL